MFVLFANVDGWQQSVVPTHNRVLGPTTTSLDVGQHSAESAWQLVHQHLSGTVGNPEPVFRRWYADAHGSYTVHAPRRGYPAEAFALEIQRAPD